MSETFAVSGLRTRRAALAGEIEALERRIGRAQVDLSAIDAVLVYTAKGRRKLSNRRLYGNVTNGSVLENAPALSEMFYVKLEMGRPHQPI